MKSKVTERDGSVTGIPTELTLSTVRAVSVLCRVENLKFSDPPYYTADYDYYPEVEPASASSIVSRVDEEWDEFAKSTYYNAEPEESTLEFVEVETI